MPPNGSAAVGVPSGAGLFRERKREEGTATQRVVLKEEGHGRKKARKKKREIA